MNRIVIIILAVLTFAQICKSEDIIWSLAPVNTGLRSVADQIVNIPGPSTENEYALAQIYIPIGRSDPKAFMQAGTITEITTFFTGPSPFVPPTDPMARLNFVELSSGQTLPPDSYDPDEGIDVLVDIVVVSDDGTQTTIAVTTREPLDTIFGTVPPPIFSGCGLPPFAGSPFRIREGIRYFVGLTPINSGFSAHCANEVIDSSMLASAVRVTNPPDPPASSWTTAVDPSDMAELSAAILIRGTTETVPRDFYLSFSGTGEGEAATNVAKVAEFGDTMSAYIWVREDYSIGIGASIDICTSTTGVVEFTAAETFQADIVNNMGMDEIRWEPTAFGATGDVSPDFIDRLIAFRVKDGTGILSEQVTGMPLSDSLHDTTNNAFLFGKIDLNVIGKTGDIVEIKITEDFQGIVDEVAGIAVDLDPDFGSIFVQIGEEIVAGSGDVNGDGTVTLLDVGPFVDRIVNGDFSCAADCNLDGVVNLLDVGPFVSKLTGD